MARPAPPKLSLPAGLPQFVAGSLPPSSGTGEIPIPVDAQVETTYDAYWVAIGQTVPFNVNRVQAAIARLPGIVG